MKKILYVIFPVAAFSLILINLLFGHLLFDFGAKQDLNKYSIYIHLLPEWQSYPTNIIFDVTTSWTNPETNTNDPYYDPEIVFQLETEYNFNEVKYIEKKPYVELKHTFSDCKNEWKPILYRRLIDSIRSQYENIIGMQLNSDPYVVVYPKIPNNEYSLSEQKTKLESGFSYFIPICTSKDVTSYDYSVMIKDEKVGFDVYFVPSIEELNNFQQNTKYNYYQKDGCFGHNLHSFSGSCDNVEKNGGLLIMVPDELQNSLTKIVVNLHEKI
ncbi:MAG TPA: hypothetical protein VD731_04170 [Nitrosopumilaceae archaeon]|nr:hypothetical protein [Nitrosopumilaceae archaeon]